jgi:hypothetical protein
VAALPTSTEYELLIRDLTSRISAKAGVNTTRLEHNVRLQGRATTNQIDVLWDFTDAAGQDQRVILEARSYARTIEQGKLHAFRSVVDDVQDHSRSVKGVMVTTVGYQRGAKTIADTYGLLILELRPPLPQDLKDRLIQIDIQMVVQHVSVTEVDCKAVEIHEPAVEGISYAVEHMTLVPRPGEPGEPRRLLDVLTAGELGELGSPRAPHPVQRTFDPPVELWMGEQRIALLQAVEAMVGELPGRPATITIGGVESLAYMLRDALTNARVWFAADGRVWATD